MFSTAFIAASTDYSTYTHHVPAPCLRRSFQLTKAPVSGQLTICGLGFYRVFINGKELTKGLLAPYIANPDEILYYDSYDLSAWLTPGENVLGILLGNGILNSPGGHIWRFDQAAYRSAPKVALSLCVQEEGGSVQTIYADEQFRVHPSAIVFDDMRCGEIYDARLEQPGWLLPGFDDKDWKKPVAAQAPRGVPTLCAAEPIARVKTLQPVCIRKDVGCLLPEDNSGIAWNEADFRGYLYDFGENLAGILRLKIRGTAGQRISIQTGELLSPDGQLDLRPMSFQPLALDHKLVYTLKGGAEEEYLPSFTYFGMRYCLVSGITPEQAGKELLTFEVMSSALGGNGAFSCSDPVVNQLQQATYRADISNFYYFPTDCPHREKNGWTGDVSLSAEQLLYNLKAENSLKVWLDNVRAAQTPEGNLPGIVPATELAYKPTWGGPAWDSALFVVPYYIWLYRGDTGVLEDNADAMIRYLQYLSTTRNKQGLLEYGLRDYVPILYRLPQTSQVTSSTLYGMDICHKASQMLRAIGRTAQAQEAQALYQSLRSAARTVLIEPDGYTVMGRNQSAQAMGLYYGLFDPWERKAATDKLLSYIDYCGGHMDVGVLGGHVLFHALAQNGHAELAYQMIVGPDYPSYGHWVVHQDCTALFETFARPEAENPGSKNHHFWGAISAWFYQYLAGIKLNPYARDVNELEISPCFIPQLDRAEAYQYVPSGKVQVQWQRTREGIALTLDIPQGCYGYLRLPDGYSLYEKGYPVATGALPTGRSVIDIFSHPQLP